MSGPDASIRRLAAPGAGGAVASLPLSFHRDSSDRVVAVRGARWLHDASNELLNGAAGVLAVPTGAQVDRVTAVAIAQQGRPVVIDDRWSHNPAVVTLKEALERTRKSELIEMRAMIRPEDDPNEAFLDLAVLADILTGPLATLRMVTARATGRIATASDSLGRALHLSVQRSPVGAGDVTVRAMATSTAVDAHIPASSTAAPAIIREHDRARIVQHPTVYESAHRAAWRELHAAVCERTLPTDIDRRSRMIAMIADQFTDGPHAADSTAPHA
ncbi:hypothetical protein HII28_18030 [Planctomonas sp. JC2975]|uniref:hypothetical protein n=1 Tax=Planctomonas sp. JC2975 TaxID=2729626 RepID=UPI001472BAB2|nr:hypothetical protein [Planctomonas sp. JC2975]NNC13767.1 hypothetical protein [Planctomonas sp. JC2975]